MSFLLRQTKRKGNNNNDRFKKDAASTSSQPHHHHHHPEGAKILPPRPQKGLNRNIKQPQKTHMMAPAKAMVHSTGSQILLQRQIQNPQKQQASALQQQQQQRRRNFPRSQTTKTRTTQPITQPQEKVVTGVISMKEVMEDLRILEQQQKEAEQKLKQARMKKEFKQDQHAKFETTLENLKYSNGELRAQIKQYHEALSFGTRELGVRRLATDKNSDDIKAFERLLKNGLKSTRIFMTCRRKIDSAILVLENKTEILKRIKAREKQKLKELQEALQESEQHEHNLRSSIQQQANQKQTLALAISELRAENRELEREMLNAKSMEESTKLRADGIIQHIANEKQRHKDLLARRYAQIKEYQKEEAKVASEEEELIQKIKENQQELQVVKASILSISEDCSCIVVHGSDGGLPTLDRNRMKKVLAEQDAKTDAQRKANEALEQEIKELEAELQRVESDTATLNENASKLASSAREQTQREQERRKEIDAVKEELEKERKEADKLRQSAKDMEERRLAKEEEHNKYMADNQATIAQTQEETAKLQKEIEEADAQNTEIEAALKIEQADAKRRLQDAKESANHMLKEFEGLEEKYKVLNEKAESEFEKRCQESSKKESDHLQETDRKISKLLEEYPELAKVEFFQFDPSKTNEEQAAKALKPLTSELEERIRIAEEARESRKDKLRREEEERVATKRRKEEEERRREAEERAAAQRREMEERVAAKRRKEEEERRREAKERAAAQRREMEERVAAKRHKEEEERRREAEERAAAQRREMEEREAAKEEERRKVQADIDQRQKLLQERPDIEREFRRRKGAEFFFPNSQGDISEEETPVQAKRLLPAFSRNTTNTLLSSQGTMTSQNTDKRVRWDDDHLEGTEQNESGSAFEASSRLPTTRTYGNRESRLTSNRGKKSEIADAKEGTKPRSKSSILPGGVFSEIGAGDKSTAAGAISTRHEIGNKRKSSSKSRSEASPFSTRSDAKVRDKLQSYAESTRKISEDHISYEEDSSVFRSDNRKKFATYGNDSPTDDEKDTETPNTNVDDTRKNPSKSGKLDTNQVPEREADRVTTFDNRPRYGSSPFSSDDDEESVVPKTNVDVRRKKPSKSAHLDIHPPQEKRSLKSKSSKTAGLPSSKHHHNTEKSSREKEEKRFKSKPKAKAATTAKKQRGMSEDGTGLNEGSTKIGARKHRPVHGKPKVSPKSTAATKRGGSGADSSGALAQATRPSKQSKLDSRSGSTKIHPEKRHSKIPPKSSARAAIGHESSRTNSSKEEAAKTTSISNTKSTGHKVNKSGNTSGLGQKQNGNRQLKASRNEKSEAKRRHASRSGYSSSHGSNMESKGDKKEKTGESQFDSLATISGKPSSSSSHASKRSSSSHASKRSSTMKDTGASSSTGQAGKPSKESSSGRSREKDAAASKKRRASSSSRSHEDPTSKKRRTGGTPSSQASAPTKDGATKHRRRKKKEMPVSRKKPVLSLAAGDFKF